MAVQTAARAKIATRAANPQYVLGIDLGKVNDPTAVALIEHTLGRQPLSTGSGTCSASHSARTTRRSSIGSPPESTRNRSSASPRRDRRDRRRQTRRRRSSRPKRQIAPTSTRSRSPAAPASASPGNTNRPQARPDHNLPSSSKTDDCGSRQRSPTPPPSSRNCSPTASRSSENGHDSYGPRREATTTTSSSLSPRRLDGPEPQLEARQLLQAQRKASAVQRTHVPRHEPPIRLARLLENSPRAKQPDHQRSGSPAHRQSVSRPSPGYRVVAPAADLRLTPKRGPAPAARPVKQRCTQGRQQPQEVHPPQTYAASALLLRAPLAPDDRIHDRPPNPSPTGSACTREHFPPSPHLVSKTVTGGSVGRGFKSLPLRFPSRRPST